MKLEMCPCSTPICRASFSPVSFPDSIRLRSAFRRFSCSVVNFMMTGLYQKDILFRKLNHSKEIEFLTGAEPRAYRGAQWQRRAGIPIMGTRFGNVTNRAL